MPPLKVLEGTWEEVRSHDDELKGTRVRLEVLAERPGLNGAKSTGYRSPSGRSILRHVGAWRGDDAEVRLREVYETRTEAEF